MVVSMSCEGWMLAPCATLLLLFLLVRKCDTSTENTFSKEILAVASKSGAIPVLARGFLAGWPSGSTEVRMTSVSLQCLGLAPSVMQMVTAFFKRMS